MIAAKSIGRRLFARAAVGVPTALKFGQIHSPPSAINRCAPASAVGAAQMSAAEIAKSQFREKVWSAIRTKGREETDRANAEDRRRMMMGGLDADLSVLNSMALSRRVQIQLDREKAREERHRGLRAWIIRSVGGSPEDFE